MGRARRKIGSVESLIIKVRRFWRLGKLFVITCNLQKIIRRRDKRKIKRLKVRERPLQWLFSAKGLMEVGVRLDFFHFGHRSVGKGGS